MRPSPLLNTDKNTHKMIPFLGWNYDAFKWGSKFPSTDHTSGMLLQYKSFSFSLSEVIWDIGNVDPGKPIPHSGTNRQDMNISLIISWKMANINNKLTIDFETLFGFFKSMIYSMISNYASQSRWLSHGLAYARFSKITAPNMHSDRIWGTFHHLIKR